MDTYAHVMPTMQEEAAEQLDRLVLPWMGGGENVGKMLSNGCQNVVIEDGIESEPHRNRTCNLLIKSHDPYMLSGTGYIRPVSDIRKYWYDLCLTFYLLLSSVVKLVGKMLAKILRLRMPDV